MQHEAMHSRQRAVSNISDLVLPQHHIEHHHQLHQLHQLQHQQQQQREVAPIGKKRRGRQARQSLLTTNLKDAISRFTSVVGAPIVQPGGFRDFNGWLNSLARPQFSTVWLQLCGSVVSESNHFGEHDFHQLKKDVIHEIINQVVKRKTHESSKLVSTNARRQCIIPPTGNTVMTLLESYLAGIERERSGMHEQEGSSSSSGLRGFSEGDLKGSSSWKGLYDEDRNGIASTSNMWSSASSQASHREITGMGIECMDGSYNEVRAVGVSDCLHGGWRASEEQKFEGENDGRLGSIVNETRKDVYQSGSFKWHNRTMSTHGRQQKQNGRKATNSSMDISSLLSEEHTGGEVRKDRDLNLQTIQRKSNLWKSKLPSLSQLDAQIQMREQCESVRKR